MGLVGPWRLDVVIMVLYQLTLFFSVQLLFVIFLDFMPTTYCNEKDYCYKMRSKCLTDYDPSQPNLCPRNHSAFRECVIEKKRVDFYSAQWDFQQDCTQLRMLSSSTVTFIGTLFGNIVLGYLADTIGRKPVYVVSVVVGVPSIILSAAINDVKYFYIFRCLTGFAVAGTLTVGWTYGSEMITPSRRFRLRTFPNWANARMIQVGFAWIAGEWRIASYMCAGLSAMILPMIYYLPESPVFLEQKHKFEKARAARMKIAEICRTDYVETDASQVPILKKITPGKLWRSPRLRRNFLVLCFMWFYVGTTIYVTDLNGSDMSKNFYVGQFFSGMLLTVSKISIGIAEPHFSWLGRRLLFLIAQGISLFAYAVILFALYTDNKQTAWYTLAYMSAYAFQSICLESCYLSLAELMPTDVRTTAGAITNILMKIGTILATTTKPLKFFYEPLLFWFNLILASAGFFVVFKYLEESRNINLQTVGQDDISDDETEAPKTEKTEIEKSEKTEKSQMSQKSEKLMTTRLIVKNLPAHCTEANLRKFFDKYGKITDASLKYTKEGKFRGFAFVGFDDEDSAKNAIQSTNQTFMDSKKLQVEECRPFGDANKPRAWSKYAKDSSAYKRAHGEPNVEKSEEKSEPVAKKSKTDSKFDEFLEAKGVDVEKAPKLLKNESEEEKKLLAELMEGIEGDTSLSLLFTGLPASIKMKNVKEWLNPIRIKAVKVARNEEAAAAFVSFNRPPDVRRALQKDGQFLGGFKIGIRVVEAPKRDDDMEEYGAEFVDRQKEEETIREKILETGRLFVRNLPFVTKEADLQYLFKKFGEISDIQVIINKTDGLCKGFAIVEFVFPESAVAAYSALDGVVFKGRMMHILPGDEKRETKGEEKVENGGDATKTAKKRSFKEEKQENLKENANKAHSWNALFLGPNAIADTLAERLNVSKADLLTAESGESAGVRLALAETRLVRETRDFLIENGVRLDAFSKPATKRSDTVMLAKNLPAGVQIEELERMFEKFGNVKKILMPPEGGVSALIIMGNPVDAKKAFKALAYSRFRSQPLYLEWAPYDAVESEAKQPEVKSSKKDDEPKKSKREMTYEERKLERKRRQQGIEEELEEADNQGEQTEVPMSSTSLDENESEKKNEEIEKVIEPNSALFVKNLSFDTTDSALDTLFRKRFGDKIKSAQISKKLNPADPSKNLSMGFGFVQFYRAQDAKEALKSMQGELLDGHCLELKISHRENANIGALKRKDVQNKEQGENTKLLVRNIPFEANIKEIESLFETFGEVKNIRIPRKPGEKNQHRGFGFVDFISVDEARRAFEALVHSTHLYGRRLVLEWAKEDDTVDQLREKTAEKFAGDKGAKKKLKAKIEEFHKQLQVADDEKD
ncbi:unnamed protein product [Caenorhabditis bovis]|uniref:Uncharacterized protein n=1 Tax=Caenorhabditis bovis TaxID=2654633 RepID=A0A8S1F494_9PELO|nr:unnamed protein product [Caenorhabditis bovis]